MTDDREYVRRLFGSADEQPPDVADSQPGPGLTAETLQRQSDAVGTQGTWTKPGALSYDVDGLPAGVGPSTTEPTELGDVFLSPGQAEAIGYTQEKYPGVHIADARTNTITINPYNREDHDHD